MFCLDAELGLTKARDATAAEAQCYTSQFHAVVGAEGKEQRKEIINSVLSVAVDGAFQIRSIFVHTRPKGSTEQSSIKKEDTTERSLSEILRVSCSSPVP